MNLPRRRFLGSSLFLLGDSLTEALASPLRQWTPDLLQAAATPAVSPVQFVDVAKQAGLTIPNVWGGVDHKRSILEAKGSGLAFFDYDHDGWLDIYLTNGSRLDAKWPAGQAPTSRLYKNNRDGTFTDVTAKSGLGVTGWQTGVCVGDYDNDGWDDLFCCFWGHNILFRNNGDGTFTDVTRKAGLYQDKVRWGAGCAFLDYDRDGHLDLFVCNYVALDPAKLPAPGDASYCQWKGVPVLCGPRGLPAGTNILFHNNGDGTFTDVSEKSGILKPGPRYSITAVSYDFDNDGWPDIYVANDSTAATLYQNQKDGTFRDVAIESGAALSPDGKPQAGMGVAVGDYNRDGNIDIVKTNFAGDTDSLYANNGDGSFEDRTYIAGLGINTRLLGWGVGFFDMDNDGWLDIFVANGHVYPEVNSSKTEAPYAEHKYLYRNLRNGRFEDVTDKAGPGITANVPARGCAFGDYDNDGVLDIAVNCVNSLPQLLRCTSEWKRSWIKIKTVGVKSNRTGIGARVKVVAQTDPKSPKPLVQIDEVRSGGSYYSQNDLRLHFGLDQAKSVDLIEIRWPSGEVNVLKNLQVNQLYTIQEGGQILKAEILTGWKTK